MAYARTRKHYRVAEKEMEAEPEEGIFIADEAKNRLLVLTILLMIMVFLKGLIIGMLVCREARLDELN